MSIDTYVGINHWNVPADRNDDYEILLKELLGYLSNHLYLFHYLFVSYVHTPVFSLGMFENLINHQSYSSYTDVSAETAKLKLAKIIWNT